MTLSLKHWKQQAAPALVAATGAVGTLAVYKDEVLMLIHDAPFPVPPSVDAWIGWTLKVAATALTILTVFTKKGPTEEGPTDIVAS